MATLEWMHTTISLLYIIIYLIFIYGTVYTHRSCRALVATLAGMFLANTGVLPPGAPELHAVYKYLLPLAIPMLLFQADIK